METTGLAFGNAIDGREYRRRRAGRAIAPLTLVFVLNSAAAVSAASVPSAALNGNQQNVSNAVQDYLNRTDSLPAPFVTLSADSLSQASGAA